jgi:hypothetical protein
MIKHDLDKLKKMQQLQMELTTQGVISCVNTHDEGFCVLTIQNDSGEYKAIFDSNTSLGALDKMLADVHNM